MTGVAALSFVLAVLAAPAATEGTPDPAAEPYGAADLAAFTARARAERLAEDPGWRKLGHWRPRVLGGLESEADGPAFFRSPRGKTDPAAELEATLAGLFEGGPHADELDDAACRFPARLAFLSRRLGLDPSRLPPRRCPRRDDFLSRTAPRGVTLVFSSYYLNNPSSAFGHTLLRLDKAEEARGGKHFELLDHGVNYAATPDTSSALLYLVKGLLGGFKGEFKAYAYYYKVREYSDAESRDLWEYDLALSPDEVAMLALHVWELGGTWFDYWYLDENCSYHVLGALEAAAPRLDLLSHVGRFVVLPSDTVKAVARVPGLVRAVHYRPSIRAQFVARAERLSGDGRAAVEALEASADAPLPALPTSEQAAILDAAVDLVDLRRFRALVEGKDPAAAAARQRLLERRAALLVPSEPLEIAPPLSRAPHVGHASSRAGLGAGAAGGDGYAVLDVRLALHDLADPPEGHPDVAALEFLPARLRFYGEARRVELDEAWLVSIVSLSPFDRFDRRPSWKLRVGAAAVRDAGCAACVVGQAEVGAGLAALRVGGALDVLGTADVVVEGAPRLSGIDGAGVRVGIGPGGLVRLRMGERLTALATAGWRWLPLADPGETWSLGATVRLHVVDGLSISLEARREPSGSDAAALLLAYF